MTESPHFRVAPQEQCNTLRFLSFQIVTCHCTVLFFHCELVTNDLFIYVFAVHPPTPSMTPHSDHALRVLRVRHFRARALSLQLEGSNTEEGWREGKATKPIEAWCASSNEYLQWASAPTSMAVCFCRYREMMCRCLNRMCRLL